MFLLSFVKKFFFSVFHFSIQMGYKYAEYFSKWWYHKFSIESVALPN